MEGTEIRSLSPLAFEEIGKKLDTSKDWKDLAFYCINSTHIEAKEIEYNVNRTHKSATIHILEEWIKWNATATVSDLIGHLHFMNRHDVIQVIQELWKDNLLTPRQRQFSGGSSSCMSSTHFRHECSIDRGNDSDSMAMTTDGSFMDVKGNYSLSQVTEDEVATPCAKIEGPNWPTSQRFQSGYTSNSYQQNSLSPKNPHKKTESAFLHLVSDDPPSSQYLTWPKMAEKTVASYSPRSWTPEVSPVSQPRQNPTPTTSGNSMSHRVDGYIYDGNGLRSHVPSDKGHVFITYSAASSRYVPLIHNALQTEGYNVLTDIKRAVIQRSETSNHDFQTMLVKGVENCKYVLCLLCEEYIQELKVPNRSTNLMNIQFINQLMEDEFMRNGKQNKRFIPFCLNESMAVSTLPPYLTNCPKEIQESFVTVINKALGKGNSNLVIYRVENKPKKRTFRRFFKKL